ncbi:MAG: helix-turn-helix domain-containing protein [Verrucomicrobiota bacterium]
MKTSSPSPTPSCVSRAGFADMLDVSVRTVDRMIAAKEIPVHRVRGKVVRILRSDAERYLAGGSAAGNGETKNLKTKNQTGELTPESNRTNQHIKKS